MLSLYYILLICCLSQFSCETIVREIPGAKKVQFVHGTLLVLSAESQVYVISPTEDILQIIRRVSVFPESKFVPIASVSSKNLNEWILCGEAENKSIICQSRATLSPYSLLSSYVAASGTNHGRMALYLSDQLNSFHNASNVVYLALGKLICKPNEQRRCLISARSANQIEKIASTIVVKDFIYFHRYSEVQFAPSVTVENMNFIHSFSESKFAYFVYTSELSKSGSGGKGTYVVSICLKDPTLKASYIQIPLTCQHRGRLYTEALSAVSISPGKSLREFLGIQKSESALLVTFASDDTIGSSPSDTTTVCAFSVRQIREKMVSAVSKCMKGRGNTGPSFLQSHACNPTEEKVGRDFCAQSRSITCTTCNFPVADNKPIQKDALVVIDSPKVTSMLADVVNSQTVLFFSQHNGRIRKFAVESGSKAIEIPDGIQATSGQPILPDMVFSPNREHIYAVANDHLIRVDVADCNKHSSCDSCLAAKDPYCGWCVDEQRCSKREACRSHSVLGPMWLTSFLNAKCPRIQSLRPNSTQIGTDSLDLSIVIEPNSLPQGVKSQQNRLQCKFSCSKCQTPFKSPLRIQNNEYRCQPPSKHNLPAFDHGKDHMNLTLSIVWEDVTLTTGLFVYYDCSRHDTCSTCVESEFECTWCIKKHSCTNSDSTCPSKDILVNWKKVQANSQRRGKEACPRIESETQGAGNIYVHNGTSIPIKLKVLRMPLEMRNELACRFVIDHTPQTTTAKIKEGEQFQDDFVVHCLTKLTNFKFSYSQKTKSHNVELGVLYNNNLLDNPSKLQVVLYSCRYMANQCGKCLLETKNSENKMQCGWCLSTQECTRYDIESNNPLCSKADILRHDSPESCNSAFINKVSPKTAPQGGKTPLIIDGQDLGIDLRKIDVELIDRLDRRFSCKLDVSRSNLPNRLQCTLSGKNSVGEYKIRLLHQGKRVFQTKSPVVRIVSSAIRSIEPRVGPISSGTLLRIHGENLDAGFSRTIKIGPNDNQRRPCSQTRIISPQLLTCRTTPPVSETEGQGHVVVLETDQTVVTSSPADMFFTFKPDPEVFSVSPRATIYSGGVSVDVTGVRLNIIQEPKIWIGVPRNTGNCSNITDTKMICRTPSQKPKKFRRSTASKRFSVQYGFHMDNVLSVQNLSSNRSFGLFAVFPDPVFLQFEESPRPVEPSLKILVISGKHINNGTRKRDIRVSIDHLACPVEGITNAQLTCGLPKLEQHKDYEVVVRVGYNLTFPIGSIRLSKAEPLLPLPLLIIIACGIIVFIVIILIILCIYRRKSKHRKQKMLRAEREMAEIEKSVADHCKDAFAELNIEVTEFMMENDKTISIPFFDYRIYCMRVLFPNADAYDHPVVNELKVDNNRREQIETGLRDFGLLLNNKTFLLIFIRAMEEREDFLMRNRVEVASLLSVALQANMPYQTDVLKTLLSDLIERTLEKGQKGQLKLILRRAESVAEKMLSNWFAFLLYRFLRDCAGEPLFRLFRAIKQQIDQGPVDSLTGEAKYTLSEDKLIRQKIECRKLTLHVQDLDVEAYAQSSPADLPVKVLDCDSISQVKEKILDTFYKNVPYSRRQSADEFDLEWRPGTTEGRLPLQDEDRTTVIENGFKRLNTLAHYKVSDSAIVYLVPKQYPYVNGSSLPRNGSMSTARYENVYTGAIAASIQTSRLLEVPPSGSLPKTNSTRSSPSSSLSRSNILARSNVHLDLVDGSNARTYHLVKPSDQDAQRNGTRSSKMVSEIYLTRLLQTKGALQPFVDSLFDTIFSCTSRGSALPLAIKYIFDFFDDQALQHGIIDSEGVVHRWKSHSLPLRFWVNMIKNPNFIFDVHKTDTIDSCLSVLAGTFMESCSPEILPLGKDSPSSKLLYNKDTQKYRNWVQKYYTEIQQMPAINEVDMNSYLDEESKAHKYEFNTNGALFELYKYALKYNEPLLNSLEEDEFARRNRLANKLDHVFSLIEPNEV